MPPGRPPGRPRKINPDDSINLISEDTAVDTLPPPDPDQIEQDLELDRLISAVPRGEGYYLKIYRKSPLPPEARGKLILLETFDLNDGIDDLESHVLRLAKQNSWPAGTYQIRTFRHGRPGFANAPIDIPIDPITSPVEVEDKPQRETNPGERLRETLEIARLARESFGQTAADPTTIAKAIAEAVALGAKAVAPAPVSNPTEGLLHILLTTGALKPPDPLGEIAKLKAAGLLPEPKTQDQSLLDQITAIKAIVEALGGLGGGGGEEKTNPTVELIRALAPQAGQIIGSITGAVSKYLDYQSAKMRVGGPQAGTMAESTTALPIPPTPPQPALPTPPKPEDEMFALINEIARRAVTKEYEWFPTLLRELESGPFGQMVQDHASGKLTDQEILGFLGGNFTQLGNQTSQEYLAAFLHWHTAHVKPNGKTEEQGIVGACQSCGEEYGYENHDDFNTDSKVCDAKKEDGAVCNGSIELKVGV